MTTDLFAPKEPVKVLIVDDRHENRLALKAVLASPDYDILEAESEAEALHHLLHEDVAVILLDVVMPDMDGFELAELIKSRDRTAAVPIIFLTAEAMDPALLRRGYDVGAVDYLVKPLMPEVVQGKVAVFSQLYRQRKQIEAQARRLVDAERRENELRVMELQLAGERRYRTLAEAVPHIVWSAQPDGHVDYFNRRWFEFTDLPANDPQGWFAAVHPDDAADCRSSWHDSLERGQPFTFECRLLDGHNQSYRWHLVRALPERSASGEVISWLGTFTDIDDQKRVQKVLAKFKGMLDAIRDAVLIFEPGSRRMMYVNDGARDLLGYPTDELLALDPQAVMPELEEKAFRELLHAEHGVVETLYRRKDGSELPVELSLQQVDEHGGPVISIARDITERKQAEAEREILYQRAVDAVQARDEFLSVASHELRTPLTSLHLLIGTLLRSARRNQDETLPQRMLDKLTVADRQVGRLARLIDQLLDVSRINTGQFRIDIEEIDLVALTRDVIARFDDTAAEADCEVLLETDGDAVGRWDRLRLEQVIINLLTNAIKFGAGKPIEIAIRMDEANAYISVRDHGIGIGQEAKERIFQRFEQAASPREYGGLGLGLYIVQRIVEAHAGRIELTSTPGDGATFTVTLPRQPVDERLILTLHTQTEPESAV